MTDDEKKSRIEVEFAGFTNVGFYITNGKLVPVDPTTQEKFSAFIREEIALSNRQEK
jgi:hypothetical protein